MMKRKSLGVLGRKEKGGFCNKRHHGDPALSFSTALTFFVYLNLGNIKIKYGEVIDLISFHPFEEKKNLIVQSH